MYCQKPSKYEDREDREMPPVCVKPFKPERPVKEFNCLEKTLRK
jgi:hypothetical protein